MKKKTKKGVKEKYFSVEAARKTIGVNKELKLTEIVFGEQTQG